MRDHKGTVVWFTGLSGSGKSTLANAVAARLSEQGWSTEIVDGDALRQELSAGLGFSRQDREENARRAAYLAERLALRVDFVLVALIAPYRVVRAEIAAKLSNYREIYVNAPLTVCESRDPKGLYRKARAGKIKNFTGLDDPYEPPLNPALECRTDREQLDSSVRNVLQVLAPSCGLVGRSYADLVRSALDADPRLTMAKISERVGFSTRHFAARLRESANQSFREIRNERLLAHSKALLRRSCAVKEVAFLVGFGSPEAFDRFFRRGAGCCPGAFREIEANGKRDLSLSPTKAKLAPAPR